MSGGHFDYKQYQLEYMKDQIEDLIHNNENYSVETIKKFEEAIQYLNLAFHYVHRIDWLVSGDDSEESFHSRLKEDLQDVHAIPESVTL